MAKQSWTQSLAINKQREVSPGLCLHVSVSAASSPCWSSQLLCIVESYWLVSRPATSPFLLPATSRSTAQISNGYEGVRVNNLTQNGKLHPLLTVYHITEAAACLYPQCERTENGECRGKADVSCQQKNDTSNHLFVLDELSPALKSLSDGCAQVSQWQQCVKWATVQWRGGLLEC